MRRASARRRTKSAASVARTLSGGRGRQRSRWALIIALARGRISALCSPTVGARRRSGGRAPSKEMGRLISSRPCSGDFWIMPMASVCGSARTSCSVFTGAQGTPTDSRRSTHSPLVRVSMIVSIIGTSTSRCFTRSGFVANRGSTAHSGCSSTSASLAKSRSLPAATTTGPFLVSKPWKITRRRLPVRCRVGSSPDSRKLAKCPVSQVSAVSNSDVSTTHPCPVR